MGRIVVFMILGAALAWVAWLLLDAWRKHNRQSLLKKKKLALVAELAEQEGALPGGSPENPIQVSTPAVIESRAGSITCIHCQGAVLVVDHQARTFNENRLRIATVECKQCGKQREIFFHLTSQTGQEDERLH